MEKLYVAYGSNCNIKQVRDRCKDSILIGTGYIKDYQLRFKGVATIVQDKRSKVPVTAWKISEKDEIALDIYEGVKNKLYRKETITVHLNSGGVVEGMVYILNNKKTDYMPNMYYFNTIVEGYMENDLDIKYLLKAYEKSYKSEKEHGRLQYKKFGGEVNG